MITSSITKKILRDQEEQYMKKWNIEMVEVFKGTMEHMNKRTYEDVKEMFYFPVKERINYLSSDTEVWHAHGGIGYERVKRKFIDLDGNFDKQRFLELKNEYLNKLLYECKVGEKDKVQEWKEEFGPHNDIDEQLTKILNDNDNICNDFEVQNINSNEYDIIVNNYSFEYGLSMSLHICGYHPLITDRELWLDKPGYFEHNNIIRKKIIESVPSWETDKDKIGDLTYHYKDMKGTILHEEWILDKIAKLPVEDREKYKDSKFTVIFYGTSVICQSLSAGLQIKYEINEGQNIDIDKIKEV